MHYIKKTQIEAQVEAQVKILLFDKVSATVLIKYSKFGNVFSTANIIKFLKYIRINAMPSNPKKINNHFLAKYITKKQQNWKF